VCGAQRRPLLMYMFLNFRWVTTTLSSLRTTTCDALIVPSGIDVPLSETRLPLSKKSPCHGTKIKWPWIPKNDSVIVFVLFLIINKFNLILQHYIYTDMLPVLLHVCINYSGKHVFMLSSQFYETFFFYICNFWFCYSVQFVLFMFCATYIILVLSIRLIIIDN